MYILFTFMFTSLLLFVSDGQFKELWSCLALTIEDFLFSLRYRFKNIAELLREKRENIKIVFRTYLTRVQKYSPSSIWQER